MINYERVWLKPVGDRDDPVYEGEDCSAERADLHFSKRRPAGVRINANYTTPNLLCRAAPC